MEQEGSLWEIDGYRSDGGAWTGFWERGCGIGYRVGGSLTAARVYGGSVCAPERFCLREVVFSECAAEIRRTETGSAEIRSAEIRSAEIKNAER